MEDETEQCCFICDQSIKESFIQVISVRTKYTDTLLINKLSDFVGNECTVVVTESDYVCDDCYKLFNKMDKLESDLENFKLVLCGHLNSKYGIFEEINDRGNEGMDPSNSENITHEETDLLDKINHLELQESNVCEIDITNKKNFYCDICNIKMQNETRFHRHITKKHVIKEQTFNDNCKRTSMFTCLVCHFSFNNLNLCIKHIEINHLNVNFNMKLKSQKRKRDEIVNDNDTLLKENTVCIQSNEESSLSCNSMSNCNSDELMDLKSCNLTKLNQFNNIQCNNSVENGSGGVVKSSSVESSIDKLHSLSVYVKDSGNINSKKNLEMSLKTDDKNISDDLNDLIIINKKYASSTINNNSNSNEKIIFLICQKCGKLVESYCNVCKNCDNNGCNEIQNIPTNLNKVVDFDCDAAEQILHANSDKIIVNDSRNDMSSMFIDTVTYSGGQNYENRRSQSNVCDNNVTNTTNNNLLQTSYKVLMTPSEDNLVQNNSTDVSNQQNILQFIELLNENSLLVKESHEISTTDNSHTANDLKTDKVHINNIINYSDNLQNEKNMVEIDSGLLTDCNNTTVSQSIKTFKNFKGNISPPSVTKLTVSSDEYLIKNDGFHCLLCNKIFKNELSFEKHNEKHVTKVDREYLINCFICNDKFTDIGLIYSHILESHSDWKGCYCFTCNMKFNNFSNNNFEFIDHCKGIHLSRKICTFCGKNFKTESHFINHIEFSHRNNLNCNICDKTFDNYKKLKSHEKNHSKREYSCDVCDKLLKTQSGLRVHKLLHSGEYPFICEFCGKGFISAHSLNEHKSNHVKEPRYVCDVCGKKFCLYDTYHKHRKHHDDPYPKQCDICKQNFRSASRVSEHKRRKHTFERPYKCPYCPLSFHISNLLKYHLYIHTKQYPFTCSICKKGFPTRNKHAVHMLKKHKDDSFIKNRFPNNKEKREEWLKLSRKDIR